MSSTGHCGVASPRAVSARSPRREYTAQANRARAPSTASFTFSGGVSIKDAISINLSAQTGYDSGAEVNYYVIATARGGRWICGKNNLPGGSNPPPRLLVAH